MVHISIGVRNEGDDLAVVDDVTFHAPGGTTTALVGASGCGKSTLLRIVAGLEDADRGTVSMGGAHPEQRRAGGELAVAFQDAALLPCRTLAGNVALGRRLARLPAAPQKVAELIQPIKCRD